MNRQTKELNRLNNELDKQLNVENDKVLSDIICYLRVANISEYNQEIIRQDLLEMVLSSQERGENIQTVIGEDYKVFCDDIIASLPSKNIKEKIFGFLNSVFLCICILSIINIIISKDTIFLIRNIIIGEPLNFQIAVSVGTLITCGIIIAVAFISVHVICKTSFKHVKKESNVKLFVSGSGIMTIFLFLAWIGKSTLFTVNIFAACISVLVLYIAHKIFAGY